MTPVSRPTTLLFLQLGLGTLMSFPATAACSSDPSLPADTTTGIAGPFDTPSWPDLPGPSTGGPNLQPPDKQWTPPAPTGPHPTPKPEPNPDLQWLLLTEVHSNPEGKDGGPGAPEFVELVHTGNTPIELGGLQLQARTWPTLDFDELGWGDLKLDPGQTVVVQRFEAAALPDPAIVLGDAGVELAFAASSGLRNADGAVLVADSATEEVIDAVVYGGPQPPPFANKDDFAMPAAKTPESGNSICRVPFDIDTNSAADWLACPPSPGEVSLPEPGETDSETTGESETTEGEMTEGELEPTPPGALVIREVLANPEGSGSQEKHYEFIELINTSDVEVDLQNWQIADSLVDDAPGTDPLLYRAGDGGCQPQTCLAPGHVALLVGNAYQGVGGDALVLETDDTTLADGGLTSTEPVVLLDPEGQPHSTYRQWEDPSAEPNPLHTEQAVVRSPQDPDLPSSWAFAEPTPGS